MDDYKQPDTPETTNEVEMLLDQQAVDPTLDQAGQTGFESVEEEPVEDESVLDPVEESVEAEPELDDEAIGESIETEPKLDNEVVEELIENESEPDDEAVGESIETEPELDNEVVEELTESNQSPEVAEGEAAVSESALEQPEVVEESQIESDTEQKTEPQTESASIQSELDNEQSEPELNVDKAVTLDAIQDPESVKIVNKAKQLLNDLDEAQKEKTRLMGELKQSEKAYSSMERSVAEGITTALKKKKEEIAATYDRELSQYQDQIDVCKTERAKAKANAIAQRIQVETAPLNQQNQQLEAQIELKFKENKVPVVCKKRAISMLFFPKNGNDWTIDILVGIGLMFIVPLLFSLTISNRFALAFTFFLYAGILFAAYMYLLHKFMLKFAGVNDEVEELRKQIRVNNKNKQLMTNRIRKSQDETGYNLGGFDDKIAGIQQVMQDTVAKRQEALENFESEIRHQITADITAANKDELLGLQRDFESKRQELADKKELIEEIEKQLKEEYETVFGKDLLYKQRLNKFDAFCQENADLSLEDALAQYRALSGGSKLLKK